MVQNVDELINLIINSKVSEHRYQNIELKRSWNESYGHKISMHANRLNQPKSFLVIGIEDSGELSKFDEKWAKSSEEIISQHVNKNLDPIQAFNKIHCTQVNDSSIIIIEISNPGAVVFWNNKAYKGSGSTIAEMTPEEIMELTVVLPGMSDYSKQKWSGESDKTLVGLFVQMLLEKRDDLPYKTNENIDSLEILSYLRIHDNNVCKILFGDISFRIVFYDNNEEPVLNEQHFGLFKILTQDFIETIQKWTQKFSGNDQDSLYPEKALKEGLANAVAHAAYFESGGDIILEVFKDRIQISNLCLPESGYFANRWFSRSHKTINEQLMEVLRLVKIVDELGRGKNLIFTESMKAGKKAPYVTIEKAGRYNRWRLTLFSKNTNSKQIRLLNKLREVYDSENKALIANALVLWHRKPVTEIRKYIDGESAHIFAEIISDLNGPIFFFENEDRIILNRWVRILLDEGKESKALTEHEELGLYNFSYDMQTKYNNGIITPSDLRRLAHMADSSSEKVLSSNILKKWCDEKKIDKVKKGVYRFKIKSLKWTSYEQILNILQEASNEENTI